MSGIGPGVFLDARGSNGSLADFSLSPQEKMAVLSMRRQDMGGTPITASLVPTTYSEKVLRMWDYYNSDPLFKFMVNRVTDFVANGAQFEVGMPMPSGSYLDLVKREERSELTEREEAAWNQWAETLNDEAPNVLPGLNEITSWATRHMLLSGMFIPMWQWGTMKVGRLQLVVPTVICCQPASAVLLVRKDELFLDEDTYLASPQTVMGIQSGSRNFRPVQDGDPRVAMGPTTISNPRGVGTILIPRMGTAKRAGDIEGVAVKYQYSPADLVSMRRSGQLGSVGQALYPLVPYIGLLPSLVARQKLMASDLSVLDGLINYIVLYSVGDKDNPPEPAEIAADGSVLHPSTLQLVRDAVREGRVGDAFELFLPYYVKMSQMTPETTTLLSSEKYVQPTLEILSAFGILFARSTTGSRERMEKINIANFEQMLERVRDHVRLFYMKLVRRIMALNGDKLKYKPRWIPMPLNTKSEQFFEQLTKLASTGEISSKTRHRYYGLDPEVERSRIARELSQDVDDLFDANVRVSYKQQAVLPRDPGGQDPSQTRNPVKETGIPPTKQQGRPPGTPTTTEEG